MRRHDRSTKGASVGGRSLILKFLLQNASFVYSRGVPALHSAKLSVLIADDHALLRKGLIALLAADSRFDVVAEAEDGAAALKIILRDVPDFAIVDMDLPKMNGLDLVRALRHQASRTKVIILTLHRGCDLLYAALDLGVRGYVLKGSPSTDVLEAIDRVGRGSSFVSSSLHAALVERASPQPGHSPYSDLTGAEVRVLRRVSAGLSSREIARELGVTVRTIETHRTNICCKLSLAGSNALLRHAMAHRKEIQRFGAS